jgi:hypothetical protein
MISIIGGVRLRTNDFWLRSLRALRATARYRDVSFTAIAKAQSPRQTW